MSLYALLKLLQKHKSYRHLLSSQASDLSLKKFYHSHGSLADISGQLLSCTFLLSLQHRYHDSTYFIGCCDE